MVTNRKVYGKAMSMPAGIGIGVAVNVLITVIGCALIAKLIDASVLEIEAIGYGTMIILLMSSFLGALAAAGLVKRRRLLVCMTVGGLYLGLLLLINGFLFGGAVSGVGVTALLLLSGTGAAALVETREKGKRKAIYKKGRTG